MNFTSLTINYTKEFYMPPYINSYENCLFFHIETTGHYWRNSIIQGIYILYKSDEKKWIKKQWILEQESDEYDILLSFSAALEGISTIIGFNSTSFHLPYLEQKYKSYGLTSPFANKIHYDQLKGIRSIGKKLHISTKLNDLRIFFRLNDRVSDIECIAISGSLFSILNIFNGDYDIIDIKQLENEVIFSCKTNLSFPADIRIHQDEFYLIGSENTLMIKVKSFNDQLKLYFPNYKEYFYLPEENTVIHKSLASAIAKDKKIRANPDNCFSYISCNSSFLNNTSSQKKFLTALLQHYMTT